MRSSERRRPEARRDSAGHAVANLSRRRSPGAAGRACARSAASRRTGRCVRALPRRGPWEVRVTADAKRQRPSAGGSSRSSAGKPPERASSAGRARFARRLHHPPGRGPPAGVDATPSCSWRPGRWAVVRFGRRGIVRPAVVLQDGSDRLVGRRLNNHTLLSRSTDADAVDCRATDGSPTLSASRCTQFQIALCVRSTPRSPRIALFLRANSHSVEVDGDVRTGVAVRSRRQLKSGRV